MTFPKSIAALRTAKAGAEWSLLRNPAIPANQVGSAKRSFYREAIGVTIRDYDRAIAVLSSIKEFRFQEGEDQSYD